MAQILDPPVSPSHLRRDGAADPDRGDHCRRAVAGIRRSFDGRLGRASTALERAPTVIRSYGPNGAQLTTHTPSIGDAAPKVVRGRPADWTSIGARDRRGDCGRKQAAGVRVEVRPGEFFRSSAPRPGRRRCCRPWAEPDSAKNVSSGRVTAGSTVSIVICCTLRERRGRDIRAHPTAPTSCSRNPHGPRRAHSKVSEGLRSAHRPTTRSTRECGAYKVVIADAKADIAEPARLRRGDRCILHGIVCGIDATAPPCSALGHLRPRRHAACTAPGGAGADHAATARSSDRSTAPCRSAARDRIDADQGGRPGVDRSIVTSRQRPSRSAAQLHRGAQTPTIAQAINGVGEPGQLFARRLVHFGSNVQQAARVACRIRRCPTTRPIQNNRVASSGST